MLALVVDPFPEATRRLPLVLAEPAHCASMLSADQSEGVLDAVALLVELLGLEPVLRPPEEQLHPGRVPEGLFQKPDLLEPLPKAVQDGRVDLGSIRL